MTGLLDKLNQLDGQLALLYGGESSERDVSLNSGAAVEKALRHLGLSFVAIDVRMADLVDQLKEHDVRHCFIALHGGYGEDGTLQGLLECLGITYTGSRVQASAIAMDKKRTKQLWQGANVATANFVAVDADSTWVDVVACLGEKMMIKPANEGSSIGMSVVTSEAEFNQALSFALKYDRNVIAEKWIDGNEYTVAVLGDKALPVIRMQTNNSFYDYEAKYESNDTQYLCPCGLNEVDEIAMQQLALSAFESLGCEGWGRIDVMIDSDGSMYCLEANTVPGMTDHSLVPMAANAAGFNFESLVAEIVNLSL